VPTTSRCARLQRVFRAGESPLLNCVARLSVLYEDLRVEHGALQARESSLGEIDALGLHYRTMYFVRRSLGTILEFQGGLTQLTASPEFKASSPHLLNMDAEHIDAANRYFQNHVQRLKELRNEFGGHLKISAVEFATRNFGPEVVGRVTWDSSYSETHLSLELHYANEVMAGVISSKLQGVDITNELANALTVIFDSYRHISGATAALVHAFLWERFG
jgi:hypothetical protein